MSTVAAVTPTVTIMATTERTVRVTVTTEKTVAVTVTETAEPSSQTHVDVTTPSPPDAEDMEQFDRQWAMTNARYIIEDIRVVDERLGDGIMVASALDILADSYAGLAEAGTPPGLDPAKYHARLSTLEQFTSSAADEYDSDPVDATAKYTVARRQTGIMFDEINSALGTQLTLD